MTDNFLARYKSKVNVIFNLNRIAVSARAGVNDLSALYSACVFMRKLRYVGIGKYSAANYAVLLLKTHRCAGGLGNNLPITYNVTRRGKSLLIGITAIYTLMGYFARSRTGGFYNGLFKGMTELGDNLVTVKTAHRTDRVITAITAGSCHVTVEMSRRRNFLVYYFSAAIAFACDFTVFFTGRLGALGIRGNQMSESVLCLSLEMRALCAAPIYVTVFCTGRDFFINLYVAVSLGFLGFCFSAVKAGVCNIKSTLAIALTINYSLAPSVVCGIYLQDCKHHFTNRTFLRSATFAFTSGLIHNLPISRLMTGLFNKVIGIFLSTGAVVNCKTIVITGGCNDSFIK